MSPPSPTVTVFFGTGVNPAAFILDDPDKGELDQATYTLGGDTGTDITSDAYSINVQRGRNRELDEFSAGTCTVQLYNWDGNYSTRNPDGPYFGDLVPGKRVRVEIYSQTIFEGVVARWSSTDEPDGVKTATLQAEDALAQLGRIEFDEWTATAGQTAGPRLDAALNRPEVNFGVNRQFDTGVSVLQADTVAQATNVLSYSQLVAQSDLGAFYANRDNLLTFKDRHDVPVDGFEEKIRFQADPDFYDTVSLINSVPFQSYGTVSGSDYLYTRVVVTREGGLPQAAEDATAIAAYGIRTLSLSGLLQNSDEQTLSMAEFLLTQVLDPRERVGTITIDLSAYDTWGMPPGIVAQLDLTDFCLLLFGAVTPRHLYRIEGIDHDIQVDGAHLMTLQLSDAFQAATFILDDNIYGQLDDDINPLGF